MVCTRNCSRFDPKEYERLAFPNLGGKLVSEVELSDVMHFSEKTPTSLILEVGVGTGRVLRRLASRSKTLVGIDSDPKMLKGLEASLDKHPAGSEIELIIASGQHLPFRPSVFSTVVCIRVLRYFEMPRKAIADMCYVLQPRGRLVLEFANLLRPETLSQIFGYFREGEFYPRLFDRRTIEGLVASQGMRIEHVKGWHKVPVEVLNAINNRVLLRFFFQLDSALKRVSPPDFMSHSIILCAVKNKN